MMKQGKVSIAERSFDFPGLASSMRAKMFLACPDKLAVLSNVNSKLADLSRKLFFDLRKRHPQSSKECSRACQRSLLGLIGQMREHVLDSQYEISALIAKEATRVHRGNEERREAASHKSAAWRTERVAESFYQDMR